MGDKGRQKMVGKKVCMSLCVCVCAHCKWYHGKTSLQISVNLNVNRKQKCNNNRRWIISVAAAGAVVCWKPGQLRFWIANSKIFKRRFPGNSAVLSRFCCLLYGAKKQQQFVGFFHQLSFIREIKWFAHIFFFCYCCSGFDFVECWIEVEFIFSFVESKKHSHSIMTGNVNATVSLPFDQMFHLKLLSFTLWMEF